MEVRDGDNASIHSVKSCHDVSGHFIPSKANWRNFVKAYLKDPLGEIPSPGPATASQPASGTATPETPRL